MNFHYNSAPRPPSPQNKFTKKWQCLICATAGSKDDGVEPECLRDTRLQVLHPLQAAAAQPATATQHRLYLLEHGGIKQNEKKG